MNYNNFENYIKRNEVHSQELNIVLAKTPTRLFRLLLIALAFAVLTVIVFGFFLKTKDAVSKNYLLKKSPEQGVVLTAMTDEAGLKKIKMARQAVFTVSANNKDMSQQQITLAPDLMHTSPVYEVRGKLYEDLSQVGEVSVLQQPVQKQYLLQFRLDSAQVRHYFGSSPLPQAGTVKFILPETRLINHFISF